MGFHLRENVLKINARRNRWRALGANPQILATNDMQEGVYATPAIVDGTIYVRTHSALFAFRDE